MVSQNGEHKQFLLAAVHRGFPSCIQTWNRLMSYTIMMLVKGTSYFYALVGDSTKQYQRNEITDTV